MNRLHKVLLFAGCFFSLAVTGQIKPDLDMNSGVTEDTQPKEKAVPSHVVSWKTSGYGAFTDSLKIDTAWHYYHNYHPVYKNSITNSYTGNYGGSYQANDFYRREFNTEFYLFRTHDAYLLTPSQVNFYNTTTPYTLLDYSQSENKNRNNETRLNVIHSQNINPKLNATFRYDQAKSDGQYNFQQNKNHFISLYSSYSDEKMNFSGGVIFNRISNSENGGMANDLDLANTETKYVVMRLTDARSEYRNNYIFANGEYRLGITDTTAERDHFRPVAGMLYSFLYSGNLRLFKEGHEADNSEYFPDYYLNPDFTNDSARLNVVTNILQLKFYESAQKKYSFGQRVYAGVEVAVNSYAAPGYRDAIFPFYRGIYENNRFLGPEPRWYRKSYFNAFVGGGIFRQEGKFWTWNFDGRQFVSGYKAGQTELNGVISKPVGFFKDSISLIRINGQISNRVPDYYQQRYFSNRIKWENDFVNEQLMKISFSFISPGRTLDAGINYSLINNYIYHDTTGIPAQTKSQLLVLAAYLNKEFKWRHFALKTNFLWQKASSDRFVRLPDLSARITLSYDLVVSKVLYVQLGTDVRYNTLYYADAYHPATGLFYLQNEKTLGNYPYIDGFANLKLKRTRVFAQYMNAGSLFLNKSYFSTLHYPMNQATFRLGVAWSFYN